MKQRLLFRQLAVGALIGLLLLPPQIVEAQWTVFDPTQYALQVAKRIEEAKRWLEHYTKLVEQLTTLKGVLEKTEDLVLKQNNAITTMANIGRTVRAAYQLKDQLETIITTRLTALKAIDDRLRSGIFDPEADLRDFDEYLRTSIGRTAQDTIANRERLERMDNELARWQLELKRANKGLADAVDERATALQKLKDAENGPVEDQCASCIADTINQISNCNLLIAQYTEQISDLRCQIEKRIKDYNVLMEERAKFGQQVNSVNQAWTEFNDTLDEIQRTLSK
jgi:chromosome segregation ATPase